MGPTNDDIAGLIEGCEHNKSLKRLSVKNSCVRSRTFAKLVSVLSQSVVFLDCSGNEIVGCALKEFEQLERLQLQTLVLNGNPLGIPGFCR